MGSHRAEPGHAPGHSHGHAHAHSELPDVQVSRVSRLVMLATLAVVAVAVIVGVIGLWPDRGKVHDLAHSFQFAAPGVTFPHGTVESVQRACATDSSGGTGTSASCGNLAVKVAGETVAVPVAPEVLHSGLSKDEQVQLQRIPGSDGQPVTYSYYKTDRSGALWVLLVLFVVVVLAVARLRGLFALVGLAFGALVVGGWLLPALLSGRSPPLAALVASALIMFVVLYLTHGPSLRTSAALLGTIGGLAVTAGIGVLAVHGTHLTGVADEGGSILTSAGGHLDFQGLMTCGVIIAGLGILNDVTITQASAVWELRAASPTMTRRQLGLAAMRIGRDHIASTIYTILFAYAGTALMTLLVIQLYDRPFFELLGTEQLSEEVVRSLVSGIGLILAVPLTTLVAAATVPAAVG